MYNFFLASRLYPTYHKPIKLSQSRSQTASPLFRGDGREVRKCSTFVLITDPLYLPLKRGGLVCPHLESSRKLYKSLSINLFSKQSNCLSPFRGDGRGVRNEDRFVRILRVLLNGLLIVFLYNYAVNILYIKTGDGYGFYCLLKQHEIDVQSTSNRKLPNFYEKVTDFLWESYRISK